MKFALSLLSLAALALTAGAQCSGCGTTFARTRNVTVVKHQMAPVQYARVAYVQPVTVAVPVAMPQPPTVTAAPPVTTTKTTVTTTTTKVAAPCPPTVAYAPVSFAPASTVSVAFHRLTAIRPLKAGKGFLCKLLGCG